MFEALNYELKKIWAAATHFLNFKILLSALFLLAASCTPSEKDVTQEDLKGDPSLNGFTGLVLAQTISESKVRLSWNASTNERLNGYHIYDATISPNPILIKTVDRNTTETTISGLNSGFLYNFRVRHVLTDGTEDTNTNDLFAIPYGGVTSSTVISSTEVRVNYPSPQSGEASLARFYCQIGADTSWTLMATVTDMSRDNVEISGLVPNTSYTCRMNVSVDGKEDNNLERITFVALGRADRIVFVTEPGNGQAGSLLTVQPVVHVLDENDNIVSGGPDSTALITLTVAASSPTSGTVRGTFALNAVGGVADFTDIFLQESGGKILEAVKEDTSSLNFGTASMNVESAPFNITSGSVSPTLSTLLLSPGPLVANGSDTYLVTFNLRDEFGNPVAGTRPEFSSNYLGDFISQPISSTDSSGQTTGSLSTTVSDTNTSTPRVLNISSPAGLDTITVNAPFDPGPANRVAFVVQPQNSPAGDFGMNEVRVAVQDVQGNTITSGAASTTTINLSINNNIGGATLSGTTSKPAVNGVAVFDDLGIDITDNGYSLAATGGVLNPGFSNNFNITAGVPQVISITGPTDVLSGDCSSVITLQLQDNGGNPARAIQNTTVQLSGLGNAQLYSSSSCAGGVLSTNVTFTPGTDTRTIYLTSDKVENLNIVGTDASSVLTPGNYNILVTPSQMSLASVAGAPLRVPAGQCSTALEISPLAADSTPGEVFTPTNITLTGILGSQAQVFSDAACTNLLDPASIPLDMGAPPNEKTRVYVQSPVGESLLVTLSDPAGNIGTVSIPVDVIIGPSDIDFVGPSTVVSGQCSSVFTVTLEDTQGNNVPASGNKNLTINGLGSYPSGNFYTSVSCSGGGSRTTITVPDGSSQATVYFRGIASASLNIQLTDASGDLSASQNRSITITPSDFRITAPSPAESLTSECKGPFVVETLDGAGSVTPVVGTVTANLSGQGSSGSFFSDSNCSSGITSLVFNDGEDSNSFYFKGLYPEATLNLSVTDAGAVLQSDTVAWTVIADIGWLGTASRGFDEFGDMLPFRPIPEPVSARYDGLRGPHYMAFDPTNQFLYVADYENHRILKYDYVNNDYIGWMGRLRRENGVGSTGSNIPTPSPALCVSTTNNEVLPGFCTGGRSIGDAETTGGFNRPWGIAVDDNYVYTTSYSGHLVSRHDAVTGEFEGWIGFINNVTPTASATGTPNGCTTAPNNSQTPGWCIGGADRYHNSAQIGDGRLRYPRGIAADATHLYVASERAVIRYDKVTGAFAGWVGRVDGGNTPTGSATGTPNGCDSTPSNAVTPGWCDGGQYRTGDPNGTGFINVATDIVLNGTDMYVTNRANGGVINRYDKVTGAFIETLPNINNLWTDAHQTAFDGSKFYIADNERLLKVDTTGLLESWIGKVANNAGMSNGAGNPASGPSCSELSPNDNTPGWCLGGTHKPGLDEGAFIDSYGAVYDGVGSILVSSRNVPVIRKFNVTTGAYEGSIGLESVSPAQWTDDDSSLAEYEGFDDNSLYRPLGVATIGDFLFVAEYNNSRIKKMNVRTGEVVGWLGGMTTEPTGGEQPLCNTANAMSPAPGFCTGALPYPSWTWDDINMIDDLADGVMNTPWGLASDGTTYIYVVDYTEHRIQKFNGLTGEYIGWIGRVNASPTGGDPGCSGTPDNTFTPGWCLGGRAEPGNGSGHLDNPTGITYAAGNIYVIDADNHRVSSYNATTGAFNGWIGRVNGSPTGCTVGSNGNYNVSQSGWCVGGTPARANYRNDRGGGFNFDAWDAAGIYSDGTHLYITNTRNIRIDKWTLGGVFVEAVRTRDDQYTNVWQTGGANVAAVGNGINCSYPISVWGDATHLYGISGQPCTRTGETFALWKMDKTTGNIVGWKGGIDASQPPTGGDPGCSGATGYTPGWCTGGRVSVGVKRGSFAGYRGVLTGDNHFLYVSDREGNRLVRVPK